MAKDIKKQFGLTLRMFRYRAEMSQETLAELAGLIVNLAKALGISPKELMPD